MKIREQAQRPNPGGFGWSLFERVRPLAEGETLAPGMQPEGDAAPDTDWTPGRSLTGPCAGSAPAAESAPDAAQDPAPDPAPAPTEDK